MRRNGLSLLEVILALAILAGAVAVIGEVARAGLRHAQTARDLTQAQLMCESIVAEIAAGSMPLDVAAGPVPWELASDETEWYYSVEIEPTEQPGLVAVHVTVARDLAPEVDLPRFSVIRWMTDRLETMPPPL